MGTKYTPVSLVGYNTSPPSDDGLQVDSNKVQWQKHLDKIGNPLKTQIAAIDTALSTFTDMTAVPKSSAYSILPADHLKTIECTGTFTVTLPSAATAGAGFTVTIKNTSTGVITVDGAGAELIDGSANVALGQNDSITVQVNAAIDGFFATSHAGKDTSAEVETLTNKTINADLNTLSNIDNADIKVGAAIDATKIGNGNVSNTELGYVNNVTSSIQTQLNTKASTTTTDSLQTQINTKASSGANSDITSLSGLTTDLSISQGGTGASTAAAALLNLGITATAAEVNHTTNVTSDIQAQLNSKATAGANSNITSLSGLTTDLSVSQGGTGASTFTNGGVLIGNNTGAIQATSAGTAGYVLTSNGAGVDPTFQAASVQTLNHIKTVSSMDFASGRMSGTLSNIRGVWTTTGASAYIKNYNTSAVNLVLNYNHSQIGDDDPRFRIWDGTTALYTSGTLTGSGSTVVTISLAANTGYTLNLQLALLVGGGSGTDSVSASLATWYLDV